jgi:hypothetical protein
VRGYPACQHAQQRETGRSSNFKPSIHANSPSARIGPFWAVIEGSDRRRESPSCFFRTWCLGSCLPACRAAVRQSTTTRRTGRPVLVQAGARHVDVTTYTYDGKGQRWRIAATGSDFLVSASCARPNHANAVAPPNRDNRVNGVGLSGVGQ